MSDTETCLEETLARQRGAAHDLAVELPIEHGDVTTIMGLLGDIQDDVRMIREILEDESGEEEAPEDDG